MRVMPVKDKETVLGCFAAFGVLFKVLELEKRYFLISPSIFWDMYLHFVVKLSLIKLRVLYLNSLKDNKG